MRLSGSQKTEHETAFPNTQIFLSGKYIYLMSYFLNILCKNLRHIKKLKNTYSQKKRESIKSDLEMAQMLEFSDMTE